MAFSPRYTISDAIATAIGHIDEAKGFLAAARLPDEWTARMRERALIQEAFHTAHIEGAHLTLDQAEGLLAGAAVPDVPRDDAQELLNYHTAFDFVGEYLDSGEPVTEGLIREIHRRLVQGVRGDSADPGNYRRLQNYVVNSLNGEAVYTPPPAFEVPRLMADLVTWLREPGERHPVVVSGLSQVELVRIHPFLDGNGRTARLLSTLSLYRSEYDSKRLLAISEYYDRDRPAYYEAIRSANQEGADLTPWLEYFAVGLAAEMGEATDRAARIIRRDVVVAQLGLSARQQNALDYALEHEGISISDFERLQPGVNRRTLQRDLAALADKGALRREGAASRAIYRLSLK